MNVENNNEVLNKALTLHNQGKLDEADKLYKKILITEPNNFHANHLHGCILSQKLNFQESIKYLEKAILISSSNYEANNNLAIAYKNLKNLDKSKKYFMNAIEIDNKHYKAHFNLANLYIDFKKYDDAIECLNKTFDCDPNFIDSKQRLGEVYQYMYQENKSEKFLDLSKSCFEEVIDKDPLYISAYIMLGLSHLWCSNIIKANDLFKKAHKLNHNNSKFIEHNIKKYLSSPESLQTLIEHEFEQLTHIDNDIDDIRNSKFTKKYYIQLKEMYDNIQTKCFDASKISFEMKKKLFEPLYNKPINNHKNNIINKKNNIHELEDKYLNKKPEIIVIDNLLTQESLHDLQKFCRNANIFKYPYQNGYVASFLSKGMSNKFFLQLSEDLRITYKRIFKDYKLIQAWIFKYNNEKLGTRIHADQASVNVNFWISPDEANLNKNTGGLVIWNQIPPKEWNFNDYNSLDSSEKMEKILLDKNVDKIVVPYKENRCVIFNSELFHCTDNFEFDKAYTNRRINVTLLYD